MNNLHADANLREWATYLHLSQLAGLLVPGAGYIVPIVLWQTKKDEIPGLDAHGKMVVNWIISTLIYGAVGALLCIVLIGIPLLMALGLISIIFPIIGAVKARDGALWSYPLCLKIIS
ncbi:DUF4870 domain-containing protein [Hymenobacter lutimineralis]|uniref:DUF4870 domain-containing protein n=1 Tax=Hymenobacter lutimineralis TaxID=2606448 RepID=A0A5D6UWX3_9BACT|nr:DUF4870 domain-containing protein [Hymenobacter lutimineralis]TYZ06884.1 DUF4870 domain-containing protein [Hymenobacter lutimineralis]